ITQIRIHIERETVTRNPASYPHSNRGNLLVTNPDTSEAFDSPPIHIKLRDRADQHLFDVADVAMNIAAVGFEIDYGITHKLARTVVSHVAAATGLVNADGF